MDKFNFAGTDGDGNYVFSAPHELHNGVRIVFPPGYFENLEMVPNSIQAEFKFSHIIRFETINAPSFLASYFVNGDASGIDDADKEMADFFLEANGIESVVDCSEIRLFERFPLPWNVSGEVSEYTVRIK